MKVILTALTVGTLALGLAGCSSGPGAKRTTATTVPASTSTSTPAATTTTAPPATTTTAAQIPSGFALAKSQWQQGATAPSAEQAMFWNQAATDLTGAESAAGSNAASYDTAAKQLQELASIPETNATSTQIAQAQADTMALNGFFGTPNLYS